MEIKDSYQNIISSQIVYILVNCDYCFTFFADTNIANLKKIKKKLKFSSKIAK